MWPFSYLKALRNYEYAQSLWAGFGEGRKIQIIPALIPNPDDPATGTGELRASVFVAMALETAYGGRKIEINFPTEFGPVEALTDSQLAAFFGDCDLVILGGPEVNGIAKLAVSRLAQTEPWIGSTSIDLLPGRQGRDHWISYRDTVKRRTTYHDPDRQSPHSMEMDYGIFIVRPNCFSQDPCPLSRVVLCYGAHTYGTEAAAHAFFGFSAAAALARKLKRPLDPRWAYQIDGLVNVTARPPQFDPSAGEGRPNLTLPRRTVTVEAPESIQGVTIDNPVLPLLPTFSRIARFGFVHQAFGRFWLYVAFGLAALSLVYGSIGAFTLSVLLYLIQRIAFLPVERPRLQKSLVADIAVVASFVAGCWLVWTQTPVGEIAVSASVLVVARLGVMLNTRFGLFASSALWGGGHGGRKWPSADPTARGVSKNLFGEIQPPVKEDCRMLGVDQGHRTVEDVPDIIARASRKYESDLPKLMASHAGEWVAYYGEEQIKVAATPAEVIAAIEQRKLDRKEVLIIGIAPPPAELVANW